MYLLPIPHIPLELIANMPATAEKTSITISYLGGVREEKGFQFLPRLIQTLRQKGYESSLHYLIQTSGIEILSSDYEKRIMSETLAQLKEEKTDCIELIGTRQESFAYYKLLSRTDIVLFPYVNSSQKRSLSISGILAETMAFGKVAVVPANTWLAEQIEHSGGGIIFHSPEDLPEKVIEAICNYSDLREKARRYSRIWLQFNNPDTCLRILVNHFNQSRKVQEKTAW